MTAVIRLVGTVEDVDKKIEELLKEHGSVKLSDVIKGVKK